MTAASHTASREQLDKHLDSLHLRGQWVFDDMPRGRMVPDGPVPAFDPFIWKWSTVRQALDDATAAMPDSLTQRRSLLMMNPALRGPGTTQTFTLGIQLVEPGEIAWAHRHTMAALRFGIEGDEGMCTIVDGEVFPMLPGDLVLTPGLAWHDHRNEGGANGIWLDAIDAPLLAMLGQVWYQPLGKELQATRPDRADYLSERVGSVRPMWTQRPNPVLPFRYPWREVEALFAAHEGGGSPYHGARFEYVNPLTGGAALPTMSCSVQRLRPGFETTEHRHTASDGYFVVRGNGKTVADGKELTWSARDTFVVPSWVPYRHINVSGSEDAVLFRISDEPLLRSAALYREAPETAYSAPLPGVAAQPARRG